MVPSAQIDEKSLLSENTSIHAESKKKARIKISNSGAVQQPYLLARNNTKDLDVISDVDSEENNSLEGLSLVDQKQAPPLNVSSQKFKRSSTFGDFNRAYQISSFPSQTLAQNLL